MIAIVLLFALASATTFEQWAGRHGKRWNAAETLRRKAIFNANRRFVEHFNKDATFKLSVDGPFAAMTNAEYNSLLKPITINRDRDDDRQRSTKAIPSSVDWRDTNKVPAVRDQGSCGSCYTFACLAAVESRLLIAGSKYTYKNLDLSEQQLVDCSTEQGNKGCSGGSLVFTFRHIKKNGIMAESAYPYTETEGTCAYVSSKKVVTISGQSMVTSNDEDALAEAVAEGPVAVAIDASTIKFQLYSTGVFDDSNCSSTELNHGVAAIGYGTESGVDYWLVRNSWGASWGQEGYIKMVRNKNNQCGIAAGAAYPTGVADA